MPRLHARRRVVVGLIAGSLAGLSPVGFADIFLTSERSLELIFPGVKFSRWPLQLDKTQVREIERRADTKVRQSAPEVYRGAGGETVFIDQVLGKHELITYACGINAAGTVKQIEILEYREIYGGEIQNARWREQFIGKGADAPLKLDADIRNISGATLSCRHVTDGVRRLLVTFAVATGADAAPRAALAGLPGGNRG